MLRSLILGVVSYVPGWSLLRRNKKIPHCSYVKGIEYKIAVFLAHKEVSRRRVSLNQFECIMDFGCGEPISSKIASQVIFGRDYRFFGLDVGFSSMDLDFQITSYLKEIEDLGLYGFTYRVMCGIYNLPEPLRQLLLNEYGSQQLSKLCAQMYEEVVLALGSFDFNNMELIECDSSQTPISITQLDAIVISQSVLEHIVNPQNCIRELGRVSTGHVLQSHWVDLRSHGETSTEMGHMRIPKWLWRLIRGRRHWHLNQLALDEYISLNEDLIQDIVLKRYAGAQSAYLESGGHIIAEAKR